MKRHRLNVTFTISASLHIRESALVHSTSGLGLTGYDLHCGENLQNYLLFGFQVKRVVIKKILKFNKFRPVERKFWGVPE